MAFRKSVVPYGFKTLVETLGKTVLLKQPADIHQFASIYFKELLTFRAVNPTLDLKELANLFYLKKVITEGVEKITASEVEESGDQNDHSFTQLCNTSVPIDQKVSFPIMSLPLKDKPVFQEDLIMKESVVDPSNNNSNPVPQKAAKDKMGFVYLEKPNTQPQPTNFPLQPLQPCLPVPHRTCQPQTSLQLTWTFTPSINLRPRSQAKEDTSSVNKDELASTCPDPSSVEQEDKLGNIECKSADLEVAVLQMTEKAPSPICKLASVELDSFPILTRVQEAQLFKSSNRHGPAHKSQKTARKSESTCSIHHALSSDVGTIQEPIHLIHSKAISTCAERFPLPPTDFSVLDNYQQYLIPLETDSYPVEVASTNWEFGKKNSLPQIDSAAPGDHKEHFEKHGSHECFAVLERRKVKRKILGNLLENLQHTDPCQNVDETPSNTMEYAKETETYEIANEMQDPDSISMPSENYRRTEKDFPLSRAYCSHSQASSLLNVQMLHSEMQQESFNTMTDAFYQVFLRLGDLEFQVQDVVHRLEDLTVTVNEIHSAMNIATTGDLVSCTTFDQQRNYFQN
ncbi:uncharacterized protein [Narcine bancroftii]|uniref:uncharacterized protein n=1 Tax=Narcine bancroftii TaxID=1343680 RepID=UPI0038322E5B